jgi:uncharacterized membrane protein YgcG
LCRRHLHHAIIVAVPFAPPPPAPFVMSCPPTSRATNCPPSAASIVCSPLDPGRRHRISGRSNSFGGHCGDSVGTSEGGGGTSG